MLIYKTWDFVAEDFVGFYAGPVVWRQKMLRLQDRLIANELHPGRFWIVAAKFTWVSNAAVTHIDAYDAIRGSLPPQERRGVVLIDPRLRKKDEFQSLVREMAEWKNAGLQVLYPVVSDQSGVASWWFIRSGCGITNEQGVGVRIFAAWSWVTGWVERVWLVDFNAPFQIPEQVDALSAELTGLMGGTIRSFIWKFYQRVAAAKL